MKKKIVHLDCTLRDGGYYVNWDFSPKFIKSYFNSIQILDIDYVEIGYRSLINRRYSGPFAHSKDEFIESLNISSEIKLAVMINASEFKIYINTLKSAINKLFKPVFESQVSLVRIATDIIDINISLEIANLLQTLGYKTAINIMKISESDKKIALLLKKFSEIDILYIADSFGSLNNKETETFIKEFVNSLDIPIGFHAHNNMGNALSNTLKAIESGATWVDSTFLGMGRGAGNAKTELLSLEINPSKDNKLARRLYQVADFLESELKPLKIKHCWGEGIMYYLSAINSIHPNYIQEMINDKRFTNEDIFNVTKRLMQVTNSKSFDYSLISDKNYCYEKFNTGDWNPSEIIKNKTILLIGPGETTISHKSDIEFFISNFKPYVIALNTAMPNSKDFINLRVASHPLRLSADIEKYLQLGNPLVIPKKALEQSIGGLDKYDNIFNYGLNIKSEEFCAHDYHCFIPNSLAITYALAIILSSSPENLFCAGLDGFSPEDKRKSTVDEIFKLFERKTNTRLTSITPTLYDIESKSPYGF